MRPVHARRPRRISLKSWLAMVVRLAGDYRRSSGSTGQRGVWFGKIAHRSTPGGVPVSVCAMNNAPDWIPFVPLVGGTLALVCLLFALRSGRRFLLVKNFPTSKTTGVFIGLVELKGTAESAQPLVSFLAECACVYYAWNVSEHWSRIVIETYTDSDGKTQTRTRTESGWTTVAEGGEKIPFYLQDDRGVVLIRPEGAKLEPATAFDQTCTPLNSLYYGKGPAGGVMDSTYTRRFSENAIPLYAMLYVMGQSRERADVVAPEIAYDREAP